MQATFSDEYKSLWSKPEKKQDIFSFDLFSPSDWPIRKRKIVTLQWRNSVATLTKCLRKYHQEDLPGHIPLLSCTKEDAASFPWDSCQKCVTSILPQYIITNEKTSNKSKFWEILQTSTINSVKGMKNKEWQRKCQKKNWWSALLKTKREELDKKRLLNSGRSWILSGNLESWIKCISEVSIRIKWSIREKASEFGHCRWTIRIMQTQISYLSQ